MSDLKETLHSPEDIDLEIKLPDDVALAAMDGNRRLSTEELYIDYEDSEGNAPKPCPKRETAIAFFLVIVALIMIPIGIWHMVDGKSWLPFILIGIITAIPGTYQSYIIIQAWRQVEGFSFDMVPTID